MQLTKKHFFGMGIVALSLSAFLVACQKEISSVNNPNSAKQLSLYLTDDPCQFDSVFIDIQTLEVKIDTNAGHMQDDNYGNSDDDRENDDQSHDGFGQWDTLTFNAGIYNVLRLRNGIDTLLGTANLPKGAIRKIRLTLGTNNSLVKDGVTSPLSMLAGINKYVYVKIHKEHEDVIDDSHSAMWIDFDVCESIKTIDGQYYLKPVCKPFGMKNFARIKGKVFPAAANAFVRVYNSNESATASPEDDGEYKIRGLHEGMYSITFQGSNGYKDTTITNIQLLKGQEVRIPDITLHL